MPDIFDSAQLQNQSQQSAPTDATSPATVANPTKTHLSMAERQQNAFAKLVSDVHPSSSTFSAFAAQPENLAVDVQMPDEKVLLLVRQHPITQIKWVVLGVLLTLIPLFFSFVPILNFLPNNLHVVAILGWYLMVLSFSLEAFLDWFYNVDMVTDERIIDVDFSSLLFKNISTAHLDRIEDVTITNKGYLGSIFDYGTVLIQTAGAVDQLEFENVPHPTQISSFINEMIIEEEAENGSQGARV